MESLCCHCLKMVNFWVVQFHAKVSGSKPSLLYFTGAESQSLQDVLFGSHNMHEVTMHYPMRYARSQRYKLIHNLNYRAMFPIDQDFYISPSFQVPKLRAPYDYLEYTVHFYLNYKRICCSATPSSGICTGSRP